MSTSANPDYGIVTAAAAGGVNITDKTIFHSGGSMRTAGLVFQTDGTINWRRTFTFVQYEALTDWIVPNESASASYEVRLTNLVWITMDEGFGVSPSSTVETDAASLTLLDGGAGMDTITRTGGSSNFITEGFVAGGIIRMDRAINGGNNRRFEIDVGGVAATVITLGNTGIDPLINETSSDINLSQGGWENSTNTPQGGDPDGDEDTWFDLGTRREWAFVDNDSSDPAGTQHAMFDLQIRRGTTILTTAACDWFTNKTSGGGGGGGGGCFMYGTKIIMADNSLKEIQDIEVGDIMKEGGRVKAVQVGDATGEEWFDVDGVISTGTHGMCKDWQSPERKWMRVEDSGYPVAEDQPELFYVVSNFHHKILCENGQLFSDYQEVDYMSSGWDDWVISYLNGESDVDVLRNAIISTGLESKRAKDFLAREGIYEEDYNDKKERLLTELHELEQLQIIKNS